MARGNVSTRNEYEGLFYLDFDLLHVYRKINRCQCGSILGYDFNVEPMTQWKLMQMGVDYTKIGFDFSCKSPVEWVYDQYESDDAWRSMICYMQEKITKRFPSFRIVDRWKRCGTMRVVLENRLFDIAVVDNEWSATWMLLQSEDIEDAMWHKGESFAPLMSRHHQTYLDAIKDGLLQRYGECVGYGGAWTSGPVYKREDAA